MVLGLHSGLCRSWWGDLKRRSGEVESGVCCFSSPRLWNGLGGQLSTTSRFAWPSLCGNLTVYKGAVNAFCLSTTIILLLHRTEPWSWLRGQSFYPHTALDKECQILQSPKSTHGSVTAQLNKKKRKKERKWQKDSTPSNLCWEQEPPFFTTDCHWKHLKVPHPHWQPTHWVHLQTSHIHGGSLRLQKETLWNWETDPAKIKGQLFRAASERKKKRWCSSGQFWPSCLGIITYTKSH